ncbi:hypothetical protein P3G55_18215 [Leptospira sp. 96542]|nr:hypothetical protein [Leptospira sp. 96542]
MPPFDPERPFILPILPPNFDFDDHQILKLVAKARTELGELKGFASAIPNPMLLLSRLLLKNQLQVQKLKILTPPFQMFFNNHYFLNMNEMKTIKKFSNIAMQ